jgi:hypothetical protein
MAAEKTQTAAIRIQMTAIRITIAVTAWNCWFWRK